MQPHPMILDPMFIQHDGIEPGEMSEVLATEPRGCPESGARVLMRAVLRDAILCLQGQAPDVSKRCRARIANEARTWVISRDLTYVFSFETICDVLGIDANQLRARLLSLLPATTAGESGGGNREMLSQLRKARMRGNIRTRVVQRRRRRAEVQAVA